MSPAPQAYAQTVSATADGSVGETNANTLGAEAHGTGEVLKFNLKLRRHPLRWVAMAICALTTPLAIALPLVYSLRDDDAYRFEYGERVEVHDWLGSRSSVYMTYQRAPECVTSGSLNVFNSWLLLLSQWCPTMYAFDLGDLSKPPGQWTTNLGDFVGEWTQGHGEILKFTTVHNDVLYASYVHARKNCLTVRVIRASLTSHPIRFDGMFMPDECLDCNTVASAELYMPCTPLAAGGKLLHVGDYLLLSIGDFLTIPSYAQRTESLFGKIWKFNSTTLERSMVSMGVRNPQGLCRLGDTHVLETEHGPRGGDEINLINWAPGVQNFGWPNASYGSHYQFTHEPLGLSTHIPWDHGERGFVEPLAYFLAEFSPTCSIDSQCAGSGMHSFGIGDCEQQADSSFLVASLNYRKLHHIQLNDDHTRILDRKEYPVHRRVRDIAKIDMCSYVLLTDGTPDEDPTLVATDMCA